MNHNIFMLNYDKIDVVNETTSILEKLEIGFTSIIS